MRMTMPAPLSLYQTCVPCSENFGLRIAFDEITKKFDAGNQLSPFQEPAGSQISSVCGAHMQCVQFVLLAYSSDTLVLQCGRLLLFVPSVIQVLAIGR